MEEMHSTSVSGNTINQGTMSVGMYIQHNTSIGLQCFALGLLAGIGGLLVTIANAVILGTVFGHMATAPQRESFFQFVTAHVPFELTAIVVATAAVRLGFALIDTQGYTRGDWLIRAAIHVVPTVCLAMILFALAAAVEGLISPSAIPYWAKVLVAVVSSGLLVFYLVLLGQTPGDDRGAR